MPDPPDREEVRDDLRDAALEVLPHLGIVAPAALHAAQDRAQRVREAEQRVGLVSDLVEERGRDPAADHPLTRDANDRHRVLAAAGQPRARPANRGARPAIEIADHGRDGHRAPRHHQRVG